MRKYNTNSNKSDGFTTSPVTVELNGRSIEAVHHFTNQTDTLLNLYIDTREGGIDVVMPLASDKPAYALSERGEEVLGFTEDTHDRVDENADHELVTDGGCDIARSTGIAIERTDCNQCGDLLFDTAILFTVRTVPPTWALESDWSDWHTVTAPSAQCGTCSARVREISVVAAIWAARGRPLPYDTDESDDPNADREFMTDGGEPIDDTDNDERDADVWICDCGDNLAEIGTIEIVKGSTANLRDPTPIPSPDVVCDWCGASVSGRLGVHAAYKIWQEHGESVPDSFDDVASRAHNASVDTEQLKIDDFGDGRLVTDGGEPIDNESDESGNVSKDDFEGVDIEGASNEVNETHDRDENDGADDDRDWDVGDMDLSFPPESDDTHDRVEYAEHPPVDLPGVGPYTPAFTDVDVTPVGHGDE